VKSLLADASSDNFETISQQSLKVNEDNSRVEIIFLDTAGGQDASLLSAGSLARFPNLKLVQSLRAGVDSINFGDIPEKVTVCGNTGAYSDQIAEHVFGMILYFAKNLGLVNQDLSKGDWHPRMSQFLRGRTILILGTGGIGESVARLATAFGMRTIGVNRGGHAVSNFEQVSGLERLGEIFGDADVVVITLPLSVSTFHLIGETEFRAMKSNCILVNVSRGYVIDEQALYEHLKRTPTFSSGVDVWWHYSRGSGQKFAQKFPFFELPNFLGTPHDSGFVPETDEIAYRSAVENIGRYVRNEPLHGVMNRNDYLGLKELIARAEIQPKAV